MSELPPPNQLGAPPKYVDWRPGQSDALVRVLSTSSRFSVLDLPTGVGKTVVNNLAGIIPQSRYQYTTATTGLQDQIQDEWERFGLFDVRGMRHYDCLEMPLHRKYRKCDAGPCLDGLLCPKRYAGCLYYDRVRDAKQQPRILTNYAQHLTFARKGESLGARDLLICDEAHNAEEEVARVMRLEFKADETRLPGVLPLHLDSWRAWAETAKREAERDLKFESQGTDQYKQLSGLIKRLTDLIEAEGEWVWEQSAFDGRLILEPVWAAPYCERLLFRDIKKVILSSATMVPNALRYLGLQHEAVDWISALSPFPLSSRPIYTLPCPAIGERTPDWELERWVEQIDKIIDEWGHYKGIIHTVSYRLAKMLYAASRHTQHMLLPTSRTTRDKVAMFKVSRAPCILISPSVEEGYDFPMDIARWQIMAKIPFAPVKASPILTRRCNEDKKYGDHLAVTRCTQIFGRIVRDERDFGATFILDGNWSRWFYPRNKPLFPAHVREAIRWVDSVPPAPKLA